MAGWFLNLSQRSTDTSVDGFTAASRYSDSISPEFQLFDGSLSIAKFCDDHSLFLDDIIILLIELLEVGSTEFNAHNCLYFTTDISAINHWWTAIHLDLLVFFNIIDAGFIFTKTPRGLSPQIIVKTGRVEILDFSRILFMQLEVQQGGEGHFSYLKVLEEMKDVVDGMFSNKEGFYVVPECIEMKANVDGEDAYSKKRMGPNRFVFRHMVLHYLCFFLSILVLKHILKMFCMYSSHFFIFGVAMNINQTNEYFMVRNKNCFHFIQMYIFIFVYYDYFVFSM